MNAPRAVLRTIPAAAQPVVQVGERVKDDMGGAEARGCPQVEEDQKQPLRALGRKPVLRMRMDRPALPQGAAWAVNSIGEGIGLPPGGCLLCFLRSSEADPGETG